MRARRILLAAAIVVIIVLVVTNGFLDLPQNASQVYVFERSKAQTAEEASQSASQYNWKLPDQLKLKGSAESSSLTVQVIDRSTDLVRWLIYRKSAMLIEVSVWSKCAPSNPGLAILILDSDGLIRGYRFVDLGYFSDVRTVSPSGCYYGLPEYRAVVDFIYSVPADMKSMKIWALFYSGGPEYPSQYNMSPIIPSIGYGAIELSFNLRAADKTDYAYQNYDDLRFEILWKFFTVVAILGFAFDLFAVRRVPRFDALYPLLVYILLFMIGVAGLFWSLSR